MLRNNKWLVFAISGPVLAGIVVVAYLLYTHMHQGLRSIELGGNTIYVSVADSEASREQGLGGREGLADNEGMLFVFPVEGTYAFWMKDMRFAIDILWLKSDGTIIHIQNDLVPASYPQSFAPTRSEGLARYVLELPAGYTREHQIHIGDKVSL